MREKSKPAQKNNRPGSLHGKLVAVGRIRKARGLRGELNVESLSDVPDRFEKLRAVYIELGDGTIDTHVIESVKKSSNRLFVKLKDVNDHDAAEVMRGAYIYVDSENVAPLPVDSFYMFDLEGMEVFDTLGVTIGTVIRVERYPANDVIVVGMKDRDIMLPAIKEYVLDVDVNGKRMTVNLPEGLPDYPKGKG